MTEFRAAPPNSLKVTDAEKHEVEVDACVYNVVDSYRTIWNPGVFSKSLESRQPPMCWGHDWRDPIAALKDYSDGEDKLRMVYKLDDFEAVPRARQAWAQFKSGTIRDTSFGFSRVREEEDRDDKDVIRFLECEYDETSPVLRGAVPGAQIAGLRSAGLAAADLMLLARQVEHGEMTLDQALATISAVADSDGVRSMHSHARQDGAGTVQHSHAGDVGMHAHSGLMPVVNGRATIMSGAMGPSVGPMEHTHPKVGGGTITHSHPKVGGGTITHSHPDATASHTHDGLLAPLKRSYDPEETRADAKYAMEDGSFPINNCADVEDAAKLAHNSKTYSFAQVRAHVLEAKQALGCPDSVIPDSWNSAGRSDEDLAAARRLLNDVARR